MIAFAALSDDEHGLLSEKLHGCIALAPIFTLQHVKGPWRLFCPMIGKLISGLVVGVRFLFIISGNRKVVNPDGEMLPNTRAGRWIAKVATVSPDRVKK